MKWNEDKPSRVQYVHFKVIRNVFQLAVSLCWTCFISISEFNFSESSSSSELIFNLFFFKWECACKIYRTLLQTVLKLHAVNKSVFNLEKPSDKYITYPETHRHTHTQPHTNMNTLHPLFLSYSHIYNWDFPHKDTKSLKLNCTGYHYRGKVRHFKNTPSTFLFSRYSNLARKGNFSVVFPHSHKSHQYAFVCFS